MIVCSIFSYSICITISDYPPHQKCCLDQAPTDVGKEVFGGPSWNPWDLRALCERHRLDPAKLILQSNVFYSHSTAGQTSTTWGTSLAPGRTQSSAD